MPLYFVRWGDLSISIVQARDRQQLDFILDEVGDPRGCKIRQYNGPLHIALKLDADYELEPTTPGLRPRALPKDVSNCRHTWRFRWIDEHGETGSDMYRQLVQFAFPHYASFLDVSEGDELVLDETDLDRMCKESLRKDLEWIET